MSYIFIFSSSPDVDNKLLYKHKDHILPIWSYVLNIFYNFPVSILNSYENNVPWIEDVNIFIFIFIKMELY